MSLAVVVAISSVACATSQSEAPAINAPSSEAGPTVAERVAAPENAVEGATKWELSGRENPLSADEQAVFDALPSALRVAGGGNETNIVSFFQYTFQPDNPHSSGLSGLRTVREVGFENKPPTSEWFFRGAWNAPEGKAWAVEEYRVTWLPGRPETRDFSSSFVANDLTTRAIAGGDVFARLRRVVMPAKSPSASHLISDLLVYQEPGNPSAVWVSGMDTIRERSFENKPPEGTYLFIATYDPATKDLQLQRIAELTLVQAEPDAAQ